MDRPEKNLSNPFSTGGGGTNFETRVQAAFLVLMLTGRIAPCLPPWPIEKIKLQGRYAGFNTDDFIVYAINHQTGSEAKLLAQIKHSISISKGNDTFSEVIQAAWNDFNNPALFSYGTDSFALITGPLSAGEINNTRTLLEWARHCNNEKEFINKVTMANYSNELKREKLKAFQFHLKKANTGVDVSDEHLWRFLKSFYLIGYDIDTETGSTLSLIQSLIAQSSTENPALIWARTVSVIQSYNQNAGTLSLENIPQDICDAFYVKQEINWDSDIRKLKDHSTYILEGIRTDIGGVKISRADSVRQLLDKTEDAQFIFLSGERGCGKSSIVREFVEYIKDRSPVFCLRTEDLDEAHLDRVFSAIGLKSTLSELESNFLLMPKKYLIIESLEKLLELNHTSAFTDLMQFVQKQSGWTIIASGRDYAYKQISFNFLRPTEVQFSSMFVEGFTEDDIRCLCEKIDVLRPFAGNQALKRLLNNPFFADLAFRVLESGTQLSSTDGEFEFRAAVWRDVISKEKERSAGMPLKRKQTFIAIAVNRAKLMVYGVPETNFDSGALLKLEDDNLIRRDSRGLVSPAHDIFEDWALECYIDEIFQANSVDIPILLEMIGHEPAMNRAFRLWLHQKMRCGDDISGFVIDILGCQDVARCWQDEAISAILLGDNTLEFLSKLKIHLIKDGGELLKRCCFLLRIVCKEPDKVWSDALGILHLKPCGLAWEAMIRFISMNRDSVSQELLPHITAVLDEWASLIHVERELPSPAREAGLVALYMLEMVKDSYKTEKNREKLLSVIIKTITVINDEFHWLLQEDIFKSDESGRRLAYVDSFCDMALTGLETAFLSKFVPDTLVKLAYHEWIIDDEEIKRHQYDSWHKSVEECFGLHQHKSGTNFFPSSGLKGPFCFLLTHHPLKALDFIIDLMNFCADKYAHSDLDLPERHEGLPSQNRKSKHEQVEIVLNDGGFVKQYNSARLWFAYRGLSVTPYLLQSALMAMENWLIEMVDILPSDKLEWLFDYILRNSNSVMLTAVLASIASGFPEKLGHAAFPLLKAPELYDLDLIRTVQERGKNDVDWFNSGLQREPLAEVYSKERRMAALRPWRQQSLESLAARLQLTDSRDELLTIIDELRTKVSSNDENWRFRFHRIDSRGWRMVEDQATNQIVVTSAGLEPDLVASQQEHTERTILLNRFCSLSLWADRIFKGELGDHEHFSNWLEALKEAEHLLTLLKDETADDLLQMFYGSIVKTAVVCLRDNNTEMDEEQWDWCVGRIVSSILESADTDNFIEMDNEGAPAAALILPLLLDRALSEEEKGSVRKIIVIALTHVNEAVRVNAANGIRKYMWLRDNAFAQKCIIGAIEFARLQKSYSHRVRQFSSNSHGEGGTEAWLIKFREQFACEELQTEILRISFETHSSWYILEACLMIPDGSIERSHVQILSQVLSLLLAAEESRHGRDGNAKTDIYHELPSKFAKRFSIYIIKLSEQDANLYVDQLLRGCDVAPGFIQWLLLYVAVETEKTEEHDLYWRLWKRLSTKVQDIAISLSRCSDRRTRGDERTKLIRSMLFADTPWQTVDYQNQNISLGKDCILGFVENAGMNTHVFEALASLMYHFPNIFFESGLPILAKHQKNIGGIQLISGNAAFYLERAIQRYLLIDNTQPLSKETHQNCWVLLEGIIETASSVAYYLREHLMRSRRIEKTAVRG